MVSIDLSCLFIWQTYVIAMVVNLVLRVAWILTISPGFFGINFQRPYFLLLVALLEIFRRALWNVLRIEHEHVNNMV